MSDPETSSAARKSRTRKARRAIPASQDTAPDAAGHDDGICRADARSTEVDLVEATGSAAVAVAAAAPVPAGAAGEVLFRDTIIAAAAEVGADGEGTDGLKGYLRKIARDDGKTYFGLLAKLIAPDVASGAGETVTRIERVIVRARE